MKANIKKALLFIIALIVVFTLSSCSEESSDNYTKITDKCKLTAKYEGKDFFTDGIGEAVLNRATDGDTASFKLVEGDKHVTIRFYGIDTPESTGSVEKWGKSASMFTEEILENAHSIVLEASTTPASVDSYGSRYLSYVWYKNSENDTWKNINLQIVENGYSKNNCINTAAYKYYSYFEDAEKFAKNKPLHIWDDDAEDPYYSTEAAEVTIKELLENPTAYYNDESQSGSKVRIEAYIKGYTESASGTFTFQVAERIDGKEYTINVYAGYTSSGIPSFLKVGNKYSFTGSIQKYYDALQISGLTYVPLTTGGDYLTQLEKNYYYTFDSSIEFTGNYGTALYTDATITASEVVGDNLKITVTAANVRKNVSEELETFQLIVPNKNINTTDLVGKTIKTAGVKTDDGTISILDYNEIEFK